MKDTFIPVAPGLWLIWLDYDTGELLGQPVLGWLQRHDEEDFLPVVQDSDGCVMEELTHHTEWRVVPESCLTNEQLEQIRGEHIFLALRELNEKRMKESRDA